MLKKLAVVAFAMSFAAPAHAALNPWGGFTGDSVVLTSYLYADSASVTPILYGATAFGSRTDVIAGYGTSFTADPLSAGVFDIIPRFFVTDNVGVAGHVLYTPGGEIEAGPELHGAWGSGPFSMVVNAGWRNTIGAAAEDGRFSAILAPEVALGEHVSAYVEVNPGIGTTGDDASVDLVPGVAVVFGEGGTQFATLGLQIPTAPGGAPVLGGCYSIAFGG